LLAFRKKLLALGLVGPILTSLIFSITSFLGTNLDSSFVFLAGNVFSYSCNYLINPMLGHIIDRFDLTKLRAFQNSIPFSFIKYAMTQLVDRETPA
jgi:hypothetical protein